MSAPARAETLALPLYGRRVLVTRAEDQAADFVERLERLGAEPVLCPTIQTVAPDDYLALDAALGALARFDWLILTSANGVRFTLGRMATLGIAPSALAGLRIAAIGPATADALREHGLYADFIPRRHVAEGLLEEIGNMAGMQVLLPIADLARTTVSEGLEERGARVTTVTAYRTVPVDQSTFAAWFDAAPRSDVATFTSSSTVRNFVELAGEQRVQAALRGSAVACIGPITARTAADCGLTVDVVADEHTTDGLLRSIVSYFETHKDGV